MLEVSYRDIQFSEISVIKEVWERNRKYHEEITESFKHLYSDLVFEERMCGFDGFDENHMKITLAEDAGSKSMLGYCISTFEGTEGELQTLHVVEEARKNGIGKELMDRHLEWLKKSGCQEIKLTVSSENPSTINFYQSIGFKANTVEMRLS